MRPLLLRDVQPPAALMEHLRALRDAHARFVARVHAFRLPLRSRGARAAAGAVYVSLPLAAGYGLLQWTVSAREANLGAAGAAAGDRALLRAAAARAGAPLAAPGAAQLRARRAPPAAAQAAAEAPR